MSAQPAPKKTTNLSINADLLREAKALDINLSQAFETQLAELVKAKKAKSYLPALRELPQHAYHLQP